MRNEAVSCAEADWSRETPQKFWDPGRKLMRCIRRYQALEGKAGVGARIARRFWTLSHEFWRTVTRCDIELRTDIGGGLLLPHPNGIVIHPDVVIGRDCLVFQQVTIGVGRPNGSGREVPVIGNRVNISAGARLVGGSPSATAR
ncbi:serine acetyltransferase [Paracoccus siganidrum]|uniref:serine acetyltransferase n=1 Tax=Paracoccus siganidrum TaxID=1276757 RepID=UPI001F0B790B|nr:serine acetyltransferase [Paracoccus siganidrum]